MKLLPQPGPPVSTATLLVSASRTASCCSGARSCAGPAAQPAAAPCPSPRPGRPGSRSCRAFSRRRSPRRQRAARPGGRAPGRRPGAAVAALADRAPASRTTPSVGGELVQARADQVRVHLEDLGRVGDQRSARAGSSARRRWPADRVYCSPALTRSGLSCGMPTAWAMRVGGLEADAPHVGGQPVRLVLARPRSRRRRTSCRSAPRCEVDTPTPWQEDHHLLDRLLLLPGGGDLLGPLRAQPGHLDQPPGLLPR